MRIIGFTLKKVSIEKFEAKKVKVEVKSNINIDDIKANDLSISKEKSLKFDFSFIVGYNPDVAKLEIRGSLVALVENSEYDEILKNWKKKKFENSELKIYVFNFIMNKCNIKAIQLEDELGLPVHVPLPRFTDQKPQKTQATEKESPKYAG